MEVGEWNVRKKDPPPNIIPLLAQITDVDTHDYIKIIEFTMYSELYYLSNGTDGRPIICKKTSVTGRQKRPIHLQLI